MVIPCPCCTFPLQTRRSRSPYPALDIAAASCHAPTCALKKRAGAGRGCETGGIFCCNLPGLVNVHITMERSTIFNGKIHYKWSFSIAMLNYQRVNWRLPKTPNDLQYKVHIKTPENLIKNHSNHCLYKEFFLFRLPRGFVVLNTRENRLCTGT